MNRFAVFLASACFHASVATTCLAQDLTVFLPENATYRYINASAATDVGAAPADWFKADFDDSGWFQGQGAFGTSFGGNQSNATGPGTPNASTFPGGTPWSVGFDPYLRTTLDLPASMDLTLWIAVDNGVQSIYVNGIKSTAFFNAEGQAHRWEHVLDIPASFVHPGLNSIALQIEDHGSATGFAMVITDDDPAIQPPFSTDPGTAYCFGVSCPCNNDDPTAGCANSTGQGAVLRAAGTASVSADNLVLIVSQMPANSFGLIYMGGTRASVPFGNGFRCVEPGPPGSTPGTGFLRFPIHGTGPGGMILEGPGVVARAANTVGAQITAGSTWNFQAYYRNPLATCVSTFNLSNGLSVTFH